MPTTTRLALPYPSPDDNPDGPAQFQALAERLDTVVAIPYAGDLKFSARTSEHGNWIKADGRALASGQYTALRDALIADGSPYGSTSGNPKLPDLRDRVPVGASSTKSAGSTGGAASVALAAEQTPIREHDHNLSAIAAGGTPPGNSSAPSINGGTKSTPIGGTTTSGGQRAMGLPITNGAFYWALAVGGVAGTPPSVTAHENMPPYVVGTWFIYGG